jgi:hypothetical protein
MDKFDDVDKFDFELDLFIFLFVILVILLLVKGICLITFILVAILSFWLGKAIGSD